MTKWTSNLSPLIDTNDGGIFKKNSISNSGWRTSLEVMQNIREYSKTCQSSGQDTTFQEVPKTQAKEMGGINIP